MGARDEVGTEAEEETNQGDSRVPAEGEIILESNPVPKLQNQKKQMGTSGGVEGVEPRGEKGFGLEPSQEKQWDPGSRESS